MTRNPSEKRDERGLALVMTLLIVALLAVIALGMHTRSVVALTRARNSANALTASYVLRSGVSAAMAFLERDARESSIDSLSEMWAQDVKEFPVGDGTVSVHVEDEASRFNLNTLVTPQGTIDTTAVDRFARLLKIVGINDRLAAHVAEWLRAQRAAASYALRDPSELLLIPVVDREIVSRLEPYVTVATDRSNERSINVNTASREVLSALSPALSQALVEGILEHRRQTPFTDIGELKKVQGINDTILQTFSDVIDVKSSTFRVLAEAKVSDVIRRGAAIVGRDAGAVRILAWKED